MTDYEVLSHFNSKLEFKERSKHWDSELRQLFCRLVRAIHGTGLDLYHISGNQIRFGRKYPDHPDAFSVTGYIFFAKDKVGVSSNGNWTGEQVHSLKDHAPLDLDANLVSKIEREMGSWNGIPEHLQEDRDGLWPDDYPGYVRETGQDSDPRATEASLAHSLNKILYGPPGTGKTYETFWRCVEICDGAAPAEEQSVVRRYHELVEEGRVEFVTFHQSYGYEEFIEGLRPQTGSAESDDDGSDAVSGAGFRLEPEDGLLKRIAERARKVPAPATTLSTLEHRKVFKMGLGNPITVEEQGIFEECIEEGYALLGWGGEVDWSDDAYSQHSKILERWRNEEPGADGHNSNVKFIHCFRNQLKKGDLIVVPTSQQRFRAVGEITDSYEFRERSDGIYPHRRNVNWLWIDRTGMPFSEIYGSKIVPKTVYQMRPETLRKDRLVRYIGQAESSPSPEPFVLVIDEINRGNISKVFGEAITLIEEDKRSGAAHQVPVTLPYSGTTFTIPKNLYILGTMNTADRSIALLDTALRRRFDFEELAPDPELLRKVKETTGIDLVSALRAINSRLEWLLGRDHLIGHAWFMGVEGKKDLDRIMRNKIIPMLAEYFYEDWSKVRSVLGGGDGFIESEKLKTPPELDDADISEDRYRWTVRDEFLEAAYDRLVSGKAKQANAIEDDTKEDGG